MEFLKLVRRRSFLSEFIFIGLNVAFAVAIVVVMRTTESLILATALVLISKWRVLAVRMRYWMANIQANLVDVIVSLSVVASLYAIELTTMLEPKKWLIAGILGLAYIAWLILLKPRATRRAMIAQAALALFMGTSALFSFSYDWPVSVVVVLMWLIGYAVARHILSSYDEDRLLSLSLVWGVIFAELGWIGYHWTIGYALPWVTGLYVPQLAIIALCLSFVAVKVYDSFFHYQKIRTQDVTLPILFSIAVLVVLLVFFSGLSTSI